MKNECLWSHMAITIKHLHRIMISSYFFFYMHTFFSVLRIWLPQPPQYTWQEIWRGPEKRDQQQCQQHFVMRVKMIVHFLCRCGNMYRTLVRQSGCRDITKIMWYAHRVLSSYHVVPHVCIVYCISSYRDECGGQVLGFSILTSKTYHHHHHY